MFQFNKEASAILRLNRIHMYLWYIQTNGYTRTYKTLKKALVLVFLTLIFLI